MTSSHSQLLRIQTVAERLDCSVRTVWQLIAAGVLTSIKIGPRSTRIDAAEVECFVEQARTRSQGRSS